LDEDFARRLAVARMDVSEKTRLHQFALAVSEEALGRRADVGEREIGIEKRDAAPALLDQRAEPLLALLEIELGALAVGDVADERGVGLIVAAADRIDDDLDGKLVTVGASRDALETSARESACD